MHINAGLHVVNFIFSPCKPCPDVKQTNWPPCCRNAVCAEASRSGSVADGHGGGNERLQRPVFITQSYLVITDLLERTPLRPDALLGLSIRAAYLLVRQEQCEVSEKSASTCETYFFCVNFSSITLTFNVSWRFSGSLDIPKWLSCRFESTLVPLMQRNCSGTQEMGSFQGDFGAEIGAVTTNSKPLCIWLANCCVAAFSQVGHRDATAEDQKGLSQML